MIVTMTKYHENMLKDSPLTLLSVVISFTFLETKKVLKIPNETFLKITRYIYSQYTQAMLILLIRHGWSSDRRSHDFGFHITMERSVDVYSDELKGTAS